LSLTRNYDFTAEIHGTGSHGHFSLVYNHYSLLSVTFESGDSGIAIAFARTRKFSASTLAGLRINSSPTVSMEEGLSGHVTCCSLRAPVSGVGLLLIADVYIW